MHLFLSPHYDDAILGCGGTIHHLAARGEAVFVRTVFGQNPQQVPASPIAQELHLRWRAGETPVAARIEEDEAAAKVLGAVPQRMTVWADCIYRTDRQGQPLYSTEGELFSAVHPHDDAGRLIPTIVLPPRDNIDVLYAPLGVGHHVDHQIVRDWALELGKQNPVLALKFYEEYPYSETTSALERARHFYDELGMSLEAESVLLSEADVEAKIRAIALYRSQISTFWENSETMGLAVRQYMRRVGSGSLVERYWVARR
mgnify:CR=1 FL=1